MADVWLMGCRFHLRSKSARGLRRFDEIGSVKSRIDLEYRSQPRAGFLRGSVSSMPAFVLSPSLSLHYRWVRLRGQMFLNPDVQWRDTLHFSPM